MFLKPLLPAGACLLALLLHSCSAPGPENRSFVLRKKTVYVIGDTASQQAVSAASADTSYLEHLFERYDLVNISSLDTSIRVDLAYADTANFIGKNFYDGLRQAYFTCELAIRLCNAQHFLKEIDSSLSILVLDAARPLHIQQMMWDSLPMDNGRKHAYLSPPDSPSLHNYGCAADVTIQRSNGERLDMGTPFDHFDRLSQPSLEWQFVKTGELSSEALENRKLLRYVMKRAGLKSIPTEWWHFSLCSKQEAVARFELIR